MLGRAGVLGPESQRLQLTISPPANLDPNVFAKSGGDFLAYCVAGTCEGGERGLGGSRVCVLSIGGYPKVGL